MQEVGDRILNVFCHNVKMLAPLPLILTYFYCYFYFTLLYVCEANFYSFCAGRK